MDGMLFWPRMGSCFSETQSRNCAGVDFQTSEDGKKILRGQGKSQRRFSSLHKKLKFIETLIINLIQSEGKRRGDSVMDKETVTNHDRNNRDEGWEKDVGRRTRRDLQRFLQDPGWVRRFSPPPFRKFSSAGQERCSLRLPLPDRRLPCRREACHEP